MSSKDSFFLQEKSEDRIKSPKRLLTFDHINVYEDTHNLSVSDSALRNALRDQIFHYHNESEFQSLAIEVFRFQARNNKIYNEWLNALLCNYSQIEKLHQIPFLPVQFFKSHKVRTGVGPNAKIFNSSGTTSQVTSTHYIYDEEIYVESILRGFKRAYGHVSDYTIIGLLPSYLERENSSLVYMVRELMKASGQDEQLFFLNDYENLVELLQGLQSENRKVWLIGVSFALLDLSNYKPPVWDNLTIIETGGMKGKRKEIIREELHNLIRSNWPVQRIESEYGMTELLSQAWMNSNQRFVCPPWMRVDIRDANDPFCQLGFGEAGGIQIIDLANLDSCSFISTSDLGKKHSDGSFEVLGRFDNSDIRGCNLLAEI